MCLEKINIDQTSLKIIKRSLIKSAISYFIFCNKFFKPFYPFNVPVFRNTWNNGSYITIGQIKKEIEWTPH